jgi:hypothetical protein
MALITVREAFRIRIERLQAKRARCIADAQAYQAEIDALVEERNALILADEDRFARLQALGVIEAKD